MCHTALGFLSYWHSLSFGNRFDFTNCCFGHGFHVGFAFVVWHEVSTTIIVLWFCFVVLLVCSAVLFLQFICVLEIKALTLLIKFMDIGYG